MKPLPVKRHHRLRRDPDKELKTEIKRWRRTLAHDEQAMKVADDIEKLINAGWVERRGPFEPKPRPLQAKNHRKSRKSPSLAKDTVLVPQLPKLYNSDCVESGEKREGATGNRNQEVPGKPVV